MKRILKIFEKESDKKYVMHILAAIAFFESIIFPIPVDIFTFSLAAMQPKKWVKIGAIATVWSVLGAIVGYFLGVYLFQSFGQQMIDFYGYQEQFVQVTELFKRNTFLVMFTSAFTPVPYKVFTVTGGALHVGLLPFISASLLGRGMRFFLETYLAHKFGKKITKHIMQKINIYSIIFVVLVVLFIFIKSL